MMVRRVASSALEVAAGAAIFGAAARPGLDAPAMVAQNSS